MKIFPHFPQQFYKTIPTFPSKILQNLFHIFLRNYTKLFPHLPRKFYSNYPTSFQESCKSFPTTLSIVLRIFYVISLKEFAKRFPHLPEEFLRILQNIFHIILKSFTNPFPHLSQEFHENFPTYPTRILQQISLILLKNLPISPHILFKSFIKLF